MERKVLYCGNADTYFLFNTIAKKTETKLMNYNAVMANGEELLNKIISDNFEMVIINIAEIEKAQNEVIDVCKKVINGTKSKVVLMAQGYSNTSTLVVSAAKAGVSYFMLSKDLAGLNDTYIKTLANIKNVTDIYCGVNDSIDTNGNSVINVTSKTIGVAGCISRIGTTSTAIQLVKFLQFMGKTACYVDNSGTDYISQCRDYYEPSDDNRELHKVTFDGVDVFYDVSAEIMQQIYLNNYNYIVFDCGNIANDSSKQIQFLQKQWRLLCTGSKPNESSNLQKVIREIYQTKIYYLYFSVPTAERAYIKKDVEEFDQKCYFLPFYDDCYSLHLDSIPIFSDIFSEEFPKQQEIDNDITQKKGGWFKNKRDKKMKGRKAEQ